MFSAYGKAGLAPRAVQLQAATSAPRAIILSQGICCVIAYSTLPTNASPAPVVSSIASCKHQVVTVDSRQPADVLFITAILHHRLLAMCKYPATEVLGGVPCTHHFVYPVC